MHDDSASSHRVDWVDYAKGMCIIWVVMMYATDFVMEATHSIGWMQYVVNFGQPFRMPDFFLLSGLFVARVLDRPWRSYLDSKVVHFLYFYVLWATLKFANMHGTALFGPEAPALAPEYLRMLVEPPSGPLWFIYVLALYFLAVRLLRRVPPAIVLPLAVCLQIAVTWHADMQWSVKVADKFARYFVFFYIGYLLARPIFSAAAKAQEHRRIALAALLAWALANQWMVSLGASFLPGMQLVLGFAGAGGVMLAASLLARIEHAGWLRYLGQHSIVVYLGFVIPLGMMRKLVSQPPVEIDLGTLSFIVMALSIVGALLLYWAVRRTPLRFLFERPAWARLGSLPAAEHGAARSPIP
ncbi:MAG TPA: acyltransferase family protein [Paucimonas sp.]|nr:acyltransferase family protein [Paucimonas sp.]